MYTTAEAQRSRRAAQEETAARLKRRRASLELGQRKEDFELQGLLGQGSYAHVYRARSRHSGQQVNLNTVYAAMIPWSRSYVLFHTRANCSVVVMGGTDACRLPSRLLTRR